MSCDTDHDEDVKMGLSANNDEDDDDDDYNRHKAVRAQRQQPELATDDDDDRKPPAKLASGMTTASVVSAPRHAIDEKAAYRQQQDDLVDVILSQNAMAQKHRPATLPGAVAVESSTDLENGGLVAKDGRSSSNNNNSSSSSNNKNNNSKGIGRGMNDFFSGRRPGAEHVRGIAQGLSHDSVIVQQARAANRNRNASSSLSVVVDVVAVEQTTPSEEAIPQRKRKWMKMGVAAAVAGILVATAIVLGVVMGTRNKNNSPSSPQGATLMSPYTLDCNSIAYQKQPHVITQCSCDGRITKVSNDVAANYDSLRMGFLPSAYPGFNDTLDSCSAQNQALLWLASTDGGATKTSSKDNPKLRQRFGLAMLFISWTGPNWDYNGGWVTDDDECTWLGISCDAQNDEKVVVEISLAQNNMEGTLEVATQLLTNLVRLDLSGNNFKGSSIPSQIGLLTHLQSLVLSSSSLNGTIPQELFNLSSTLKEVLVDSNTIMGQISTAIGRLTQLEHWNVNGNSMTGTVPTEIGNCSNLGMLYIEYNRFHGTIPSQVGRLTNLREWFSDDNEFTGTIPDGFWDCSNLTFLDLSSNQFNGTLSTEVGRLHSLQTFAVQDNILSGTIPTEFGSCTTLRNLRLGKNELTGSVPEDFANLSKLEFLDIRNDKLKQQGVPAAVCEHFHSRISGGQYISYPVLVSELCLGCNCGSNV